MKIIRKNTDQNITLNNESNFRLDLGWQDNLSEFKEEVLDTIINPSTNYETVRYIHKQYSASSGITQTDIWYSFFFTSGSTFIQDYNAPTPNITHRENALMLKQSTESFFRLEFYKTPQKTWDPKITYSLGEKVYFIPTTATTGNIYTSTLSNNKNNLPNVTGWTMTEANNICFEPPTRQNRKLVFAKNLSLPLGEKYLYADSNNKFYIHIPLFQGNNFRNKENMYLFWFEDEKVLDDTLYFGNNVGNTFFMSAKFFNAKTAGIIDFMNSGFTSGHTIDDSADMYYQVDFNHLNRTYCVFPYTGGTAVFKTSYDLIDRIGYNNGIGNTGFKPIKFYER